MIELKEDELRAHTDLLAAKYSKGVGAPLIFDDFLKEFLVRKFNEVKPIYPMKVSIPRSINEMLRGDFSPEKIFVVNEPMKWDNLPVWFNNTLGGVNLRFGYLNGDKRNISDIQLNDTYIHGILGGITGTGKSVALNVLIFGASMEYPPWELKLTLSDAKKAEFKRYALGKHIPHIAGIAATEDANYLISVLDNLYKEMQQINNVFAKAGVQNIKDFRKKTGLCLPQNLIIMDEFQTMFKTAGNKKAAHIAKLIDLFCRLGRSTGYHLYLASQELDGGDIPQATVDQIGVRCCLGARERASEMILGNDGAVANIGRKGRLIVNIKAQNKNKADNQLYTIPLQTPEQFDNQSTFLNKLGNKIDFEYTLSFYDEADIKTFEEYSAYLKVTHSKSNEIFLGDPAFVMDDPVQCVRLGFNGKDPGNICILSNKLGNHKRFAWMLSENIRHMKCTNLIVSTDRDILKEYKLDDIPNSSTFITKQYEGVSVAEIEKRIRNRAMLLEVDSVVFSEGFVYQNEEYSDKIMDLCSFDMEDEILRKRVNILMLSKGSALLNSKTTWEDLVASESFVTDIDGIVTNYRNLSCSSRQLTRQDFTYTFVWYVDLCRLYGLGRDSSGKNVTRFKTLMMDGAGVNIIFIGFHTSMEDLDQLRTVYQYYLIDRADNRDISRIKCEDYPDNIPEKVAVLYNPLFDGDFKCFSFKKIILPGEILN
jgi:hypothetical protein